jgi:hypothetical protein
VKTVRSHIMKFFYKYFIKHTDLRELTATTNSYDGFEAIIAELKSRIGDEAEADADYDEVRAVRLIVKVWVEDRVRVLRSR